MKALLRGFLIVAGFCALIIFISLTVAIVRSTILGGSMSRGDQVAVINLTGVIYESVPFNRELEELAEDESVKAIVVRINSPGGLVAPSQEIFRAIQATDKAKPVIVSMGSVAASGGYYASLGGRKVFANPGTLTASIGVIMEFVNTSQLLKWAKIERYSLKSGKFKDVGATFRAMKPEERVLLMGVINSIQDQFAGAVKERRQLTDDELKSTADGRILTGAQAVGAKLVDEIGGLDAALAEAKKVGGLAEDAEVRYPESKAGLLRELLFEGKTDVVLKGWQGLIEHSKFILPGWHVLLLAPVS